MNKHVLTCLVGGILKSNMRTKKNYKKIYNSRGDMQKGLRAKFGQLNQQWQITHWKMENKSFWNITFFNQIFLNLNLNLKCSLNE